MYKLLGVDDWLYATSCRLLRKDIIKRRGLKPAVVYSAIQWELIAGYGRTKKETRNFDGSYWVRYPIGELAEEIPEMTTKSIETAIKRLVKDGYIRSTDFDNAKWYTLTDEGVLV